MGLLFKRRDDSIVGIYESIVHDARNEKLYNDFNVPDEPAGRFQMIALHAIPVMIGFSKDQKHERTQILFDMIFKDIELSFREIGVGDLGVPKKMKAYMNDFNGLFQAHVVDDADHVAITAINVFDDENQMSQVFADYITNLFKL